MLQRHRILSCLTLAASMQSMACGVKYACAGLEGGDCTTVAEAYAVTSDPDWTDPRLAKNALQQSSDVPAVTSPQGAPGVAIDAGAKIEPLLTQPRVLRLWFNYWEDVDHDLHAGGYVFLRISQPTWQVSP